ncbi:transmembrane protein 199 [Zeugodacus cucurbitae]|uniref:transmembrane protein 199 n=1 Tax=Zeugodacus cucurbitae TaxID=28588 RepID=UPI0023D95489|nr:transmembrane protein 199 [Zeugodacus cucurbitae]
MTKISIADTRVRVQPSRKLLQLIEEHKDIITEIPENLKKVLKTNGFHIESGIELLGSDSIKKEEIDLKLLRQVEELLDEDAPKAIPPKANRNSGDQETELNAGGEFLYLSDLRWVKSWLKQLREKKGLDIYLSDLIENCRLHLPMNEVIERNPELEARCQRLREQQQNREYLDMTKNVDATLKYVPEDTIAYQVKAMNSQMIAVLQFIFSVAAGFVFGFLGLELIFGGIEFGLRLVLGISCALVIGVAEMYFLIKKLNEEEKAISSFKKTTEPVKKNEKILKPHIE